MISTWGDTITPVATGWMRANDEIVLALVRKGERKPRVRYSFHVTIDEAGPVSRKNIITALNDFASEFNHQDVRSVKGRPRPIDPAVSPRPETGDRPRAAV